MEGTAERVKDKKALKSNSHMLEEMRKCNATQQGKLQHYLGQMMFIAFPSPALAAHLQEDVHSMERNHKSATRKTPEDKV